MATKSNIKEIKLNRWDLGMSDEERDLPNGYFRYLENVNCGEKIRGLKQVADTTSSASTRGILAVLDINGTIYGHGKDTNGKVCIWKYDGTWNSYTPAVTANYFWDLSSGDTPFYPFFVYSTGYIYFQNGNNVGRYTISDNTVVGNWVAAGTYLMGGVAWQGDFYGRTQYDVWKVTTAPAVTNMLTFSADQKIVALIPYGNLMVIITTAQITECKMYLWDGVTTTTYYDIIPIGIGDVLGAGLVNGTIKVVMAGKTKKDFRIMSYNGSQFNTEYTYNGRANTSGTVNTSLISQAKVYRDYLTFLGQTSTPNTTDTKSIALFRYGAKQLGLPNSMSIYNNFSFQPTTANNKTNDFVILDDSSASQNYMSVFASVMSDFTGTPTIREIKTTTTYTMAGAIETGIYTGGDSSTDKKLLAVNIQTAPMPTAGQVVLKYKADADSSWTTLATSTTDNEISYDIRNIESTGANLPMFKEIAFRLELTGAVEVTAMKFKYEEMNDIYGQ